MRNQYVFWPDVVLFFGALPKQIARHQHPIIQLIIGVEKPFLKKGEDGEWYPCRSLLVAPNISHECDAAGQLTFSLSIDPETTLGEYLLETTLADKPLVAQEIAALQYFNFDKVERLLRAEQFDELYRYSTGFFATKSLPDKPSQKDERIEQVKVYIRNHLHERITTAELCGLVFLSESRLLHLFKAEMGLPIRNYILWLRLTRALEIILAGESLTHAAHEAGFFDSAHMSRTFVKQLGINPAKVVRNSKFIQVSVLEGV